MFRILVLKNFMEENQAPEEQKNKKWLEEISEQSWNPELIISGFAIYATLSLPSIIQDIYNYYISNYQIDNGFGNELMPMLICAVFITISQMLSFAFIVHFILRAFWVGYLGVISVFPTGINFDRITTYGEYGKNKLRERMQNLDVLALKLEKASSVIFGIAIIITLQFIGVCFLYLVFAILYNILQNILGRAFFAKYELLTMFVFLVIILTPSLVMIVLTRFKNHPKYGKWHYHWSSRFQKIILPIFSEHIQSLFLTFNSSISQKRLTIFSVFVGIIFAFLMISNQLFLKGASLFHLHHYYSSYSRELTLPSSYYEDQRKKNTPRIATIQSDIITTPFVRLFIAYPKKNDAFLDSLCKTIKTEDIENTYLKNLQEDKEKLKCLQNAYKIELNDSLFSKNEFMYYEFENAEKGVMMYIPSQLCKKGKNQIKVVAKKIYNPEKRPYEALITFWYGGIM